MGAERLVVGATVVVLVGIAVAAGPLVGLPILSPVPADPGTGSMTATVEESPGRATLEEKTYGDGDYSLRGPRVLVSIEALSGRPYLSYTIEVPALGHQTTSLTVVEEAGQHRLRMKPSTVPGDEVTDERYQGTISIHVIDDDGRRSIHENDVTVEVRV